MKITLIGFGEAGTMFGRGLSAKHDITAYDITITDSMRETAHKETIALYDTPQKAFENADFIFSLVTADQAVNAAKTVAPFLQQEHIYLEMNSVAPKTKLEISKLIEPTGATLIDVAIMAPVYPKKMQVPLLLSHKMATDISVTLNSLGLNAKSIGHDIGRAAAIKLCRSIIIKGLEALTVECLSTARYYGVDEDVTRSLHNSFPEMGWDTSRGDYWFSRVAQHGRRRAAEMREAAKTVTDAGVNSEMAKTTSMTLDALVDLLATHNLDLTFETGISWKDMVDLIQKSDN